MLLAIDIGNTTTTLGAWDGSTWRHQWRILAERDRTADATGAVLMTLMAEADLINGFDSVVMSSVVPSLTATFSNFTERYLGHLPLLVSSDLDLGIEIRVDSPEAVGADRIANAVAAYHLHPGPSIVLDMGTATKFDVVSSDGALVGGAIAPGLQLTADALAARAAKLSPVTLEAPPQAIGRNTVHAMQSGLVFGTVFLVEGMIGRILSEHPNRGQPISILGTGGLIDLIAKHTAIIDFVDPFLTLSGLRLIHDRVTG